MNTKDSVILKIKLALQHQYESRKTVCRTALDLNRLNISFWSKSANVSMLATVNSCHMHWSYQKTSPRLRCITFLSALTGSLLDV